MGGAIPKTWYVYHINQHVKTVELVAYDHVEWSRKTGVSSR